MVRGFCLLRIRGRVIMRLRRNPSSYLEVFEYFASIQTPSGEVLMTPADLMRAVIPVFPSSELNRVREGSLKGEWVPGEVHCAPSKNFMLFDTKNDGLVSFAECVATCSLVVAYNISTTGFIT
ncbi:calcium uptake protein, mitochondrial-like isoform X2 [Actinidia eriantha]|uniref:calcium uptake protein, mitochondrial-like isoform X2 n=1 Tax=Actinidia eriantha TaxID=165200 RepID=UPI002590859C|nr:calcium uptake protein, mitochondrial-like isoform X2 [Actinidia eriantha]